ncbi:MAG: nuclear transport factor 2 family protein [Proteobacteria bacterium]|nr:nuclear transport factor 2 family protein [Pseudomonadota bacterium]
MPVETLKEALMDFIAMLALFAKAVEAGDGDALADLFTDDGVYDDYFFGPSEPGRKGIRDMLAHFYEGGMDFRWEFFDPVASGPLGYASYRFSYTSKLPEAKGARVVFEGISRLDFAGSKIRRYSEVFDRGVALAQQDFAPERLKKVLAKYATRLKARAEASKHL